MQSLATPANIRTPQAARGARPRAPCAIVDIGSNSVRLVIYESLSRAPAVMHNEKAICAIGRNMVSTGRLNDEGIALALEALARFRMIADALNVDLREAVATAAARDAPNGEEFVRRAEVAWGAPVRILSGEDEAHTAAEGVLAGIPDANGLAADLGGGSLDMVAVRGGKTGEALTLPFGPLRLIDLSDGDADKARDIVDKGLSKTSGLAELGKGALYAVGGVWRSFARVDMDGCKYPLHVLHHYEIPKARALKLARVVSRMSKKSLDKLGVISRRRAEALPYGAIVLERLLLACDLDSVVISAYGLREGLLYMQLSPEERAKDPLIEFARDANNCMARAPAHADEMFEWMSPLFAGESDEERRIRHAVCLFSDIGWRRHPDDRALGTFNNIAMAQFAGASHRMRALIATAIYHRYSGDEDFPREIAAHTLLNSEDSARAMRLGLAARLAFLLSVSALNQLPRDRLRVTPTRVLLEISRRREAIAGEPVQKRLGELAEAFGRKGEILIG